MLKEIKIKSVLNKTKRRDPWFLDDYTINMYSSCAFNCLYCYIRGSQYGTNLAESLSVKVNAPEILDRQLFNRAKKNQYGVIVLSSATDPYPKIEETYCLTRTALELIAKYRFPVHVITKSDMIERDFDILHRINEKAIIPPDLRSTLHQGTIITFSFSTLNDDVASIFEKGAPLPSSRLKAVRKSVKAGFESGISLMPLLPFISDTTKHLELLFSTFQKEGVNYVLPATITLFGEGKAASKTLVINAIRKHYPQLEEKYVRFFKDSDEMPNYYKKAFQKKMQLLLSTHGLKGFIGKSRLTT